MNRNNKRYKASLTLEQRRYQTVCAEAACHAEITVLLKLETTSRGQHAATESLSLSWLCICCAQPRGSTRAVKVVKTSMALRQYTERSVYGRAASNTNARLVVSGGLGAECDTSVEVSNDLSLCVVHPDLSSWWSWTLHFASIFTYSFSL